MLPLKKEPVEDCIDQPYFPNFDEFYREYFPKIYNYVRFRVYDPNDTDDLVSKIFEQVLIHADRFNSEKGTCSAWVFAIANHLVIDYFRVKSRKAMKVSFDLLTNTVSAGKSPEHKAIDRELRHHLLGALQEIDDKKRELIALKFWSGLNNRQIAEITGLSESNVGVMLYRTLRQLKSILANRGVDIHE